MVFCQLKRQTQKIYYYRTKQGNVVDFIWFNDKGEKAIVQVCWDILENATRKRELRSLKQAMAETGLSHGTIVTNSSEEVIKEDNLTIHIVPAWKYFFQNE